MRPYLPSLEDDAALPDLFRLQPKLGLGITRLQEHIMRDEGPLDPGVRELIAAYVSALNACQYCVGSHSEVARQFGIDEGLLKSLVEDVDTSSVPDDLKPIFEFVRKLTIEPSRMTVADADAVFEAGWGEDALLNAACICCAFSFMNRLAFATGLPASQKQATGSGRVLFDRGYAGLAELLGLARRDKTDRG